mmetsp:Transcript_103158/g.295973  ORF Transcript_103158/g.295973 Transcript_103158/m.295973 type:complete len:203 (+) Transcript_103158:148-756(+)|eukprot:CAMPEP_0119534184 /NCGR_PEP_ID=MMETSP1344-20130328/47466_1 /TAXON_ID=236787 /ORGANISM="Florenciella parvula, Strain CCMP2471" /LENGTH=202 /DNA_ID=CAMNT_0007575371 /DNA_START=139 /DNA_END=747 /DNA_ORIENTATION=-
MVGTAKALVLWGSLVHLFATAAGLSACPGEGGCKPTTAATRRRLLATTPLLVGATATTSVAAASAKEAPPVVATDRNGVEVTEARWVKQRLAEGTRPDLVLGLDGEPYYLGVESSAGEDGELTYRVGSVALKAECTHLGCLVDVVPGQTSFSCPCHGSQYAADGTVTRGPAPRALGLAKVVVLDDGKVAFTKWVGEDPRKAA